MTSNRKHEIKLLLGHPCGVCKSWDKKLRAEVRREIAELEGLVK